METTENTTVIETPTVAVEMAGGETRILVEFTITTEDPEGTLATVRQVTDELLERLRSDDAELYVSTGPDLDQGVSYEVAEVKTPKVAAPGAPGAEAKTVVYVAVGLEHLSGPERDEPALGADLAQELVELRSIEIGDPDDPEDASHYRIVDAAYVDTDA